MSLADIGEQITADRRNAAMRETWGHLAPEKGVTYPCTMVFAVGCYNEDRLNPTPLVTTFGELEDSPWLFKKMHEFLQDKCNRNGRQRFPAGTVWRFVGQVRNYKFKGIFKQVFDGNAIV